MIESETDVYVQTLDPTDPVALEAALEAAPLHTRGRVTTADGQALTIHRVPGGWYLPGDLAVTSGDVADGRPRAVSLLREDYRDDEGWQILADLDPEDAADLAAWADAQRKEDDR